MLMSGSNTSLLFAGPVTCPQSLKELEAPTQWHGCRTQRAFIDLIILTAARITLASCSSPFGQLTALLSEVFFYDRIHVFIALDDLETCRYAAQVSKCLRCFMTPFP